MRQSIYIAGLLLQSNKKEEEEEEEEENRLSATIAAKQTLNSGRK